jgi:hypothetical protein
MPLFVPPPVIAPAVQNPPLSFNGFRAGMPLADAADRVKRLTGVLRCRATLDWRMRDCTGALKLPDLLPAEILISSVRDSAAVIVFSLHGTSKLASPWVAALTRDFGIPNHQGRPGRQQSWQWIRAGTMLRVAERKSAGGWETSVTLTHGPLLDGLGPTQHKPPG